ncbi:MAG: DUF5372 family protein, partial [Endomicrobia bacterium]|nr:DUF5372 family protein [Endomicrobiia bacterium]
HPFRPDKGKEYLLIKRLKPNGRERLVCHDSEGVRYTIPIEHTNLGSTQNYNEQTCTSCDFRYEDILKLAETVEITRKKYI